MPITDIDTGVVTYPGQVYYHPHGSTVAWIFDGKWFAPVDCSDEVDQIIPDSFWGDAAGRIRRLEGFFRYWDRLVSAVHDSWRRHRTILTGDLVRVSEDFSEEWFAGRECTCGEVSTITSGHMQGSYLYSFEQEEVVFVCDRFGSVAMVPLKMLTKVSPPNFGVMGEGPGQLLLEAVRQTWSTGKPFLQCPNTVMVLAEKMQESYGWPELGQRFRMDTEVLYEWIYAGCPFVSDSYYGIWCNRGDNDTLPF